MTNKLTWNEFVSNVQQWSTERGIYEHSTATAQLLKAFSEAGELADAVIKNDIDALKDAIGDVAVCLVNFCQMSNRKLTDPFVARQTAEPDPLFSVVILTRSLAFGNTSFAILDLKYIADIFKLDFLECCTLAWDEIKDRKGRMVEGGAFVKDE